MKLQKNVEVQVFDVLADYKIKIKKSPFIAILKFVNEQEDRIVSIQEIYDELLMPLSLKACENLFNRLELMGYVYKIDYDEDAEAEDIFFELTQFGKEMAEQEVFFEKRRGIIRISLLPDNMLVPQKIVKIEELGEGDRQLKAVNNHSFVLESIQNLNNAIDLKNDSFTIDKIEEYYKGHKSKNEVLSLEKYAENMKIKVLDYSFIIDESPQKISEELLLNEFQGAYLIKSNILQIDFNTEDLSLVRDVKISKPYLADQYFDSIILNKIEVNPRNEMEAALWHFELVKSRLDKYYLSDEEFQDFANKEAEQFVLFSKVLKDSLSRQDFIEKVIKNKDFYLNAKVETIDYLYY